MASTKLFRGVSRDVFDRPGCRVRYRNVDTGQTVVAYDDDTSDVFFVLDGRLRVTLCSATGREISFRDLGAGESFGALAAIDSGRRSADVVALAPSRLAIIDAETFRWLVREDATFAMNVLTYVTALVRALTDRVAELATPVHARVCADLLRLAEGGGSRGWARIAPPPKHADIASRINSHREAVSRTMSDLRRRGVLQRNHGELVILDVPALAKLAAGDQPP